MSERRCMCEEFMYVRGLTHISECPYANEPQDVAPSKGTTDVDRPTINPDGPGPVGATSFDSELAAIKAEAAAGNDIGEDNARTLLRMVDELTMQLSNWKSLYYEAEQAGEESYRDMLSTTKERDELRAKLTDSEHWRARHCEESRLAGEQSQKNWERAKELEAKLAEAEKKERWSRDAFKAEQEVARQRLQRTVELSERAEAAEARRRELIGLLDRADFLLGQDGHSSLFGLRKELCKALENR